MSRRVRHGLVTAAVAAGLIATYFAAPIFLAIISLGEICPYSPVGTNLCSSSSQPQVANLQEALEKANVPPAAQTYLSQPLTATLCNKPGIRYAGSTTQGMEICFTLNAERTKWIEIGFKYECASSVGEVTANTSAESYDEGPGPLADGSRITATGFEATIAGARASGVLATAESCEMKTLTWSARRAP